MNQMGTCSQCGKVTEIFISRPQFGSHGAAALDRPCYLDILAGALPTVPQVRELVDDVIPSHGDMEEARARAMRIKQRKDQVVEAQQELEQARGEVTT